MALRNPCEVWTMVSVELTTDEVELLVVVVYLIGMKGNYSPSLLLIYAILATKLPSGLWLSFVKHLNVFHVSCRSSRILLRPAVGTTTLVSHKTQPLSEDNSYFLEAYGFRVCLTVAGHPF